MNPEAIRQLQISLGLPPTGIFDNSIITAMNSAVSRAMSNNSDIARYAGNNSPDSILNAYMTGNWSGVTDLSGKPFTRKQQEEAVRQSEKALAPAFKAMASFDQANVEDTLRGGQQAFEDFQKGERVAFGQDKNALDDSAVNQGVLFSGARVQKLNDLRNTYQDREAAASRDVADQLASAARSYQYEYGNDAAGKLSNYYRMPGSSTFNANVAGGNVTQNRSMSNIYDPSKYKFQGTKPVAHKAAVQGRAASLLSNRANKLSLSGYGNRF